MNAPRGWPCMCYDLMAPLAYHQAPQLEKCPSLGRGDGRKPKETGWSDFPKPIQVVIETGSAGFLGFLSIDSNGQLCPHSSIFWGLGLYSTGSSPFPSYPCWLYATCCIFLPGFGRWRASQTHKRDSGEPPPRTSCPHRPREASSKFFWAPIHNVREASSLAKRRTSSQGFEIPRWAACDVLCCYLAWDLERA